MHRARGIYIIVCIWGVGLTSCTPPPTACPTCGDRIPADAGGVVDSGLLPNPVDAGAPACGPSNPCDGDLVCAEGDCVECADDRRCGTGQICRQNSCVQGCRGDVDCTQEALPVCVDVGPEGGTCGECETDNQCRSRRPGTVCREAVCVVPCRNGACDEGVCLDDVCVPCIADGDCERGLLCSENVCEEGCRDDDRCMKGGFVSRGNVLPVVEATTTAMPERSVSSLVACRAIVGSMTTALKVRFAAAIAAVTPVDKILTVVTGASVKEVPVESAVALMMLAASVKSASKMSVCWAVEPMEIAVRGRFASDCHVAGVALTTINALGMNCVSITIAARAAERMRTVGADKFIEETCVRQCRLTTVAVMVPSARSNRGKTWEFVSQDVGTTERAAAMPIAVKRAMCTRLP